MFTKQVRAEEGLVLGLPELWREQGSCDREPHVDYYWRCLDCDADLNNEHYWVSAELWATTGLGPDGGKLCLDCLEARIARPLSIADFTMIPELETWERHVRKRTRGGSELRRIRNEMYAAWEVEIDKIFKTTE
jgi:hypothetical protein